MAIQVWAFNRPTWEDERKAVVQSIKEGKSRFGWSFSDTADLRKFFWNKENAEQRFLMRIKPEDWIVHVNLPQYDRCIAAKVTSGYMFDEGVFIAARKCIDFRNCFCIDPASVIEFSRKDKNLIPSVNLKPRSRQQRVLAVKEFLNSIENLKRGAVTLKGGETRQQYHLKDKTREYLRKIAELIHQMNKSKDLEKYLALVFERMPGVVKVKPNGSRGGTDHGADLIVTLSSGIGNRRDESIIIVQIKSYEAVHNDTKAVDQVKTGIKEYGGNAGMVITTADTTDEFDAYVQKVAEDIGCPIDLLDAEDVARLVIKHAPDLLFDLGSIQ